MYSIATNAVTVLWSGRALHHTFRLERVLLTQQGDSTVTWKNRYAIAAEAWRQPWAVLSRVGVLCAKQENCGRRVSRKVAKVRKDANRRPYDVACSDDESIILGT